MSDAKCVVGASSLSSHLIVFRVIACLIISPFTIHTLNSYFFTKNIQKL